ncbi:S41 family peptidase [Reichenbachiella ulvae]|uniref:S41 family peptidase n=1 Tax=Reichenbachiella ulvae TaxID=2980104 RepID=A0ABT3CYL4_9BACT|nr:S41 family peptidase [Reichenbachiella ulvae]MCV9388781.1 S41 family peptidase [Reichenbachiella ulvae]
MKRSLCVLVLIFAVNAVVAQNAYTSEQVKSDMLYLKEALEGAHYDLYAYTTREDFESNFEKVRGEIKGDSLSELEARSLFQRVVAKADIGHTSIDFPFTSYMRYAENGGTLFPLELAFESGQYWVRKNWSAVEEIEVGTELLSINGRPIEDIVEEISLHISAERAYLKLAKIELYSFPRLYWQVFGEQEGFEIEVRSKEGIRKYMLEAVELIGGYEMKRNEIIDSQLTLEFLQQSAYLNPGSFSGDEPAYRQFIDSAFIEIKKKNSQNLIIDLRNNGGGDNSFSDYLLAYVADRPFQWNSAFSLKTSSILKDHVRQRYDTTEAYWREVFVHENGEIYDFDFEDCEPRPKEERFMGDVYVLVNRQSHSQAAVTASQFQDYGWATIVGEETGDYPSLYASVFRFALPQTQIEVQVSKGYMVRVNGSEKPEGVIPDILIRDHLLDEEDEILDGLLQKLND